VQIRSKLGEGTTVELWLPQANEPPSENTGNIRARSPWRQAAILSQGNVLKPSEAKGCRQRYDIEVV
jgi:hypothetical protein